MKRVLALCLLAAALVSGCGYQLVGAGGASSTTLWVAPVIDDGSEPLFGAHVRAALAREAVDRADARLAPKETAAARLAVKVNATGETKTAYVAGDQPRQYLLTAVAEVTLTSKDGRVLWRDPAVKADRQFSSGSTIDDTENNKKRALQILASDLGSEIMRRVTLALVTVTPPQ